jgi:hypothetical protein
MESESPHVNAWLMAAIGTPGDVVEQDRVVLHDQQALPSYDIPQTRDAICTPTQYSSTEKRFGIKLPDLVWQCVRTILSKLCEKADSTPRLGSVANYMGNGIF